MPIQTALDSISQNQGSPFGFKNRVINGDMRVDQRNTAAGAITAASLNYSIDRWRLFASQASKFTVQQKAALDNSVANYEAGSAPAGFSHSLKVVSSSAYSVANNDCFRVEQPIEGYNIADFGFGTVNTNYFTVSFWVKSSLSGTFTAGVWNVGGTRAYPFSYTITSTNTWEQKFITIPVDTTGTWNAANLQGLTISFNMGSGSDYLGTANAWNADSKLYATGGTNIVGTNGATWYLTGVQVEKGKQATSFDFRSYGHELTLCQRYFESYYGDSNSPHDRISAGSGFNEALSKPYYVKKRAIPTVTWNLIEMRSGSNANVAISFVYSNLNDMLAYGASSVSGTGNFRWQSPSGYIWINAEI